MFDEMNQADALSTNLYAECDFSPRRKALEDSIYYLMAKHCGSTKTLEMRN
jgi:hypothetical protein